VTEVRGVIGESAAHELVRFRPRARTKPRAIRGDEARLRARRATFIDERTVTYDSDGFAARSVIAICIRLRAVIRDRANSLGNLHCSREAGSGPPLALHPGAVSNPI
jgi:hypothetical protein